MFSMVSVDPWGSPLERREAVDYCDRLSGRIIDGLSEAIEVYSGIPLSEKGWRLLLRPTVSLLVMSAYHHYLSITKAVEGGYAPIFLDMSIIPLAVPETTAALQVYLFGDDFHKQLLVELAPIAGWSATSAATAEAQPGIAPASDHIATRRHSITDIATAWLKRGLKDLVRRLSRGSECYLYNINLSFAEIIQLLVRSGFRIAYLPLTNLAQVEWPSPDLEWRQSSCQALLRRLGGLNSFEAAVCRVVTTALPICLAEGLPQLKQAVECYFPVQPKTIASGMAWVADDAFKLWSAQASDRGARLVSAQHGGGYGMRQCPPLSERVEHDVADQFLGWARHDAESRHIVKLPVPPHFYHKQRTSTTRQLLLYVGTAEARYPCQIQSVPMGAMMLEYLGRQADFLAGLIPELRRHCLVRPNPSDLGWRGEARVKRQVPWVIFDDFSRTYLERLREARLVVIDNLNTTFLQSMASGVPTILVWDPEVWSLNDGVQEDFARLEDVGVYFHDPVQAAKKVAGVWQDPLGWWATDPVAAAVNDFLDKYFNRGCNWSRSWVAALTQ